MEEPAGPCLGTAGISTARVRRRRWRWRWRRTRRGGRGGAAAIGDGQQEEANGAGRRRVPAVHRAGAPRRDQGGRRGGRGGGVGDGGGSADAEGPSSSQESMQQFSSHHDVAMELINSVTGVDDEGRSRQRILSFAGKRYLNAIERNPDDPDAYYNWALVLQESADNVDPNSGSSKDALLEEACKKYAEATRLCPTLYDAYYNWAIAIADRAKTEVVPKKPKISGNRSLTVIPFYAKYTVVLSRTFKFKAILNYEKAVQLNWNSPQALNNWGLGLQYGLAEDTMRSGRPDVSPNELYSQSAIYVAAAHALKPNYSVYRSALRLVRLMLPLPYLKVGYLTAPPANNAIAPHKDWVRSQFVLNHEGLQQADA
ncbi:hypothetical protein ZWY2020_042373 [Hordeum vulgare]|nr:hypothetical protein ZWY2020_042373 [Hordeum vulgare]